MPERWIDFFFRHPRLTFALMGVWFLMFGVTSVNLFVQLKADIDLLLEYGMVVMEDGALQQIEEILAWTYLSMIFYLLFKLFERILVERLTVNRAAKKQALPT